MNYRQEIDGLRTIAVVAVVIYHAAFNLGAGIWLPGGFIGVDIFFVISGYLITSIIIAQESEGTFRLAQFYVGRIRRIVPALAVMILLVLPLGWRFMLPDAYETMAQSALGALGYYSNFIFAFEDAYNAEASTLKPFLHTWSLSVEGQFYVIFPLIMLVLMRSRVSVYAVGILTFVFGLSYLSSHAMGQTHQQQNFFLLPTRAWELVAGSLLAIAEAIRGRRDTPEIHRLWMPAAGMLAILAAFVFFDDSMPLPGLLSLIPVAGTMLIIWTAQKGEPITDLLSLRPVVYIGKISYSLYLWHFPVFVFMRISNFGFETTGHKIFGIAISAALAVLSYYLVERPFRDRIRLGGRRFAVAIIAVLGLGVAGTGFVVGTNGVPSRLGDVANIFQDVEDFKEPVTNNPCRNRKVDNACTIEGTGENVLLFGDSHANAISLKLADLARTNSWSFAQHTFGGCAYLIGIDRQTTKDTFWTAERRRLCEKDSIEFDRKLRSSPPLTLVYFARLPFYLNASAFDNREGFREVIKGGVSVEVDRATYPNLKTVADVTTVALRKFQRYGHRLIVVYPYPEMAVQVPTRMRTLLSAYPLNEWSKAYTETQISVSYKVFRDRTASSYLALDRLFDNNQVFRVKPEEWLCSKDTGRCVANGPDGLYYYDDDHPSQIGAQWIVDKIEAAIKSAPPLPPRK